VKVYAGTDPLTGREIRFRKTCKTERAAQIELGKLLEHAAAGRQPDSGVTVAQLLDQYVSTAGWDVSTRESNLGYIRRTINPALGSLQVRKVRGPILDTLYARLLRCGNLVCTGKPFTEHRNIPDLRPDPADRRLEWEQAADRIRAAIGSGQLVPGDLLPSVPDLARLQGLRPGSVRHALLALADEGLVHIRHGRTTTIAGEPAADEPGARHLDHSPASWPRLQAVGLPPRTLVWSRWPGSAPMRLMTAAGPHRGPGPGSPTWPSGRTSGRSPPWTSRRRLRP
jgi:DNA-binding transcriptional regulator YhcF (GntR family)